MESDVALARDALGVRMLKLLQCLKAEPLEKNLTYSTQLLANLLGSSTWLNAQNVAYGIAGKQKHH